MARKNLDQWLWQVGAELQKLSEEITPAAPKVALSRSWRPAMDVAECASMFVLKVELAGVRGEDITIHLNSERRSIVVRGVRRDEPLDGETYLGAHQLEINYGEFEREVPLPDVPLRVDLMRVQYRNGILMIVVPKDATSDEVVMTRTVTIERFNV